MCADGADFFKKGRVREMQTYRYALSGYVTLTPPRIHSSKYVNNIYTIRDLVLGEGWRGNASAFARSYATQYLPYFDDG